MRLRKTLAVLLAAIVLLPIFTANAAVSGNPVNMSDSQAYHRILFVIDCSNSMNYHDNNRLVNEIVKMFVDGARSQKTDIGFVTYNDRILESHPLTPMADMNDRAEIKTAVNQIRRTGSTDIGMALNYGMDLFIDNPKENSRPTIVLFSDGETDLNATQTGRTEGDSFADEAAAYEKSRQLGCPIYSVGISRDGSLNTAYLQKIAENSNGKMYEIRNASALRDIFDQLFYDITRTDVITEETAANTDGSQSLTLNIPVRFADETNLILQHTAGINDLSVSGAAADTVSIYESNAYTSVKLQNFAEDNVTLQFSSAPNDTVKINIIHFMDVLPQIAPPPNTALTTVPIEARLYSVKNGQTLDEAWFYRGLTAELSVTDPTTGETKTVPMKNNGDRFTAEYDNGIPKAAGLQAIISGQNYFAESPVLSVTFTNSPPTQTGQPTQLLLKQNQSREFALTEFFSDADGDVLSYTLTEQAEDVSAAIRNDRLTVIPDTEGSYTVPIQVSDGRGGLTDGMFTFDIVPFWIYYKAEILSITCIFILLLAAYILFSRRTRKIAEVAPVPETILMPSSGTRFKGARFEGYFLHTRSGNDVPVLNWNASYIENRQEITLADMFSILDVQEYLPEANKIYLEAGNNNTVIFRHDTNCVVSMGRRDIPNGKREILNYDDRLYIVFEDHVTEMELRYKRVRKLVMA